MTTLIHRYLPLFIYLGYFLFVWFCLLISPVEYKDFDYSSTFLYTLAIIILFTCGYGIGASGPLTLAVAYGDRFLRYQSNRLFFRLLMTLGVVGAIAQWYGFAESSGSLDLASIGKNYVSGYEGYERGQASIGLAYVANIANQALATIILLAGLYYFGAMNLADRAIFLFILGTYLLTNVIGTGKQKFLGDIVIFLFYCAVLNFTARGKQLRTRTLFLSALSIVAVFALFVEILRQRYVAAGIGLHNFYEKSHPLISWDDNSWLSNLLSSDYLFAAGVFSSYFTNGLYGLYLSLTLPFEWSYLIGNSYSVGRIVEIMLGSDGAILQRTYPYRVGETYGWGFDKWHSLFAWLASDFTFIGVLALTLVFGFIYARLWRQALHASTFFAGPLFIFLSQGLIFSFANNQVVHALSGVIVLVVLSGAQLLYFLVEALRAACREPCHGKTEGLGTNE